MINIAIFASGNGSNAQKIIEHFKGNSLITVQLVLSNNKNAFVLERANNLGVITHVFTRSTFYESKEVLELLGHHKINFIVLAGFMWLIPKYLVKAFHKAIVNIHPALLPKYGGKGMYGDNVHRAVKEAGENESGITIHYVNEAYDEGDTIFQATCEISPSDTAQVIASKVHVLEYQHYPEVIESVIKKSFKNS